MKTIDVAIVGRAIIIEGAIQKRNQEPKQKKIAMILKVTTFAIAKLRERLINK